MIRRTLAAVTMLAGAVALVWLGGGRGVVSLIFGWALLGYLIRSAWPVIREDAQRLSAFLPDWSNPFRRSARGDYL